MAHQKSEQLPTSWARSCNAGSSRGPEKCEYPKRWQLQSRSMSVGQRISNLMRWQHTYVVMIPNCCCYCGLPAHQPGITHTVNQLHQQRRSQLILQNMLMLHLLIVRQQMLSRQSLHRRRPWTAPNQPRNTNSSDYSKCWSCCQYSVSYDHHWFLNNCLSFSNSFDGLTASMIFSVRCVCIAQLRMWELHC